MSKDPHKPENHLFFTRDGELKKDVKEIQEEIEKSTANDIFWYMEVGLIELTKNYRIDIDSSEPDKGIYINGKKAVARNFMDLLFRDTLGEVVKQEEEEKQNKGDS